MVTVELGKIIHLDIVLNPIAETEGVSDGTAHMQD